MTTPATPPSGVSVSVTTPPAAQITNGLPSNLPATLPSDLATSVVETATSGPSGVSVSVQE